jgi:cell division protein ZapE
MGESVSRRYEAMVEAGDLDADESQRALAGRLDDLIEALAEQARTSKKSALGWLLARDTRPEPPRGLYIWGSVGRGKTMLMDLFFRAAPIRSKRRVHFHEFMGEVHDRLNVFRAKLKSGRSRAATPSRLLRQRSRRKPGSFASTSSPSMISPMR